MDHIATLIEGTKWKTGTPTYDRSVESSNGEQFSLQMYLQHYTMSDNLLWERTDDLTAEAKITRRHWIWK